MGGGVGGMVYSIKDDGNGNDEIICSHANHRGDVIARSDMNGALTSFALYEAYGRRPYEWGSDPDRQKANTKEEEADLGLLNEGFRYRDLETGTFLTRDPIGYADGPNIYCYVHCNPITHFDAFGLKDDYDYQQEIDQAQEQIEQLQEQLEMEEQKNEFYEQNKDAFEKLNITHVDKTESLRNQLTELNNKVDSLTQSQADLKNNRWGDDSITGNDIVNGNARIGENGQAQIGYKDDDGDWKFADMTQSEQQIHFSQNADGSLTENSFDQKVDSYLGSVGGTLQDNQMLNTVDNIGKGVGIGAGVVVAAPVIIAGGGTVVNAATSPVGGKSICAALNLYYNVVTRGGGEIPPAPVILEKIPQYIEMVIK